MDYKQILLFSFYKLCCKINYKIINIKQNKININQNKKLVNNINKTVNII